MRTKIAPSLVVGDMVRYWLVYGDAVMPVVETRLHFGEGRQYARFETHYNFTDSAWFQNLEYVS